jgi:hypothetical protein
MSFATRKLADGIVPVVGVRAPGEFPRFVCRRSRSSNRSNGIGFEIRKP